MLAEMLLQKYEYHVPFYRQDKEYLWMVRAVMEKLVIFHYDDGSRSGQTIRKLLKDFKGYLQSDGYSAYNVFEGTEGVCLIALSGPYQTSF